MFKKVAILDEKEKSLRKKSVPFDKSVTKEERQLVEQMIKHLTYSQIEEYEKKYDLRPGMGLAFPQLGINERIIVDTVRGSNHHECFIHAADVI